METEKSFEFVDFEKIQPVKCSCGWTKRAFAEIPDGVASLHVVDISEDSKVHFHRRMTEIYYVLEGNGHLELDGEKIEVSPGSAVLIRPGCRHRAIGTMKILNVPVPAFDPDDEWFD